MNIAPGDVRRILADTKLRLTLTDCIDRSTSMGCIGNDNLALIVAIDTQQFTNHLNYLSACFVLTPHRACWMRLYNDLPDDEEC